MRMRILVLGSALEEHVNKLLLIILCFACFTATNAIATVFVNEGWEDTPGNCWPCKTSDCTQTYNGWDAFSPAEQGGTGAETTSGISTAQKNSGTNSLLMAKQTTSTDGCNIQFDFAEPQPTTIYVRFYIYFTTDWASFGPEPGTVHWIFTNSYQSSTGFRLNLQTDDFWDLCASNGMCVLPQGDGGNNEWYYTAKVNPDWEPGLNFKDRLNEWICLEYKMQISGSNVIVTEWIDGVLTRGPSTGPGQSGNDFQWIAFLDYENAGSSNQLRYYIDDLVIADEYIGPIAGTTPTATGCTLSGASMQ
jgi:hypothetical protein